MEVEGEEKKYHKKPKKKKRKQANGDKEYGVSHGMDFTKVACVLNFDLPTTLKSYTQHVGRTGRAGQTGMALSYVDPSNLYRKHKPASVASAEHDKEVLKKIIRHQGKEGKEGKEVKPYNFDMKEVTAFSYRCADALASTSRLRL